MAKKGARFLLALVCTKCKSQNYISERNKLNQPEKLKLRKYCKHCRTTMEHKETSKLK